MLKKSFYLFTLFLAVLFSSSCSSDEPVLNKFEKDKAISSINSSDIRSASQSAKIANEAMNSIYGSSRSVSKSFSEDRMKIIIDSQSRSGSDTLMYVFNLDNNEGFAIIAANININPVIAITENGNYDPEVPQDNPGFKLYMEKTINFLKSPDTASSVKDSIKPDVPGIDLNDTIIGLPKEPGEPIEPGPNPDLVEYKSEKKDIFKCQIPPNYDIKWGQKFPEGKLFNDYIIDNGICGCTNTAMLIVMSYFKPDISLSLTYPNAEQPSLTLDWDEIMKHKQSYPFEFNCCPPQTTHSYISMICRQLAHLNNSYKVSQYATATPLKKQAATLSNMGFRIENNYGRFTKDEIFQVIYKGGKIIMYGCDFDSNNTHTAHNWVLDGLDYYHWWSGEYIREYGKDWELVNDHGIQKQELFHMNWGWYGYANGYYNIYPLQYELYVSSREPYTDAYSYNYSDLRILSIYPN